MKSLSKKSVLLTGAAGGLGKEIALLLADEEAELHLLDQNSDGLAELKLELESKTRVFTYRVDLLKPSEISEFLDTPNLEIDLLINNAGIVHGGEFESLSVEKQLETYQVNVAAPIRLIHHFLPKMKSAGSGHIVNIVSVTAFMGLAYGATYASSKWALMGFTESLRNELADQNLGAKIKLTAICPYYIKTGMFDGSKDTWVAPMLESKPLAQKIIKAIKANRYIHFEPARMRWLPLLQAVLPEFLWRAAFKITGVNQSMKSWVGH